MPPGFVSRRAFLGRLAAAALIGCAACSVRRPWRSPGAEHRRDDSHDRRRRAPGRARARQRDRTGWGGGRPPHLPANALRRRRLLPGGAVRWHGLNLEAQLEFLADLGTASPSALGSGARQAHRRPGRARQTGSPYLDGPAALAPMVVAGLDELARLEPAGRSAFAANAARYIEEIDRLAVYAERALATVPQDSRVLVTAHDAFNYFGRAYGYEVVGIQGISTESEAGLKQIEDIVKLLVERKIRSVFVESSVSERNVRALIEVRRRGHAVEIGGELFSDAMGRPHLRGHLYRRDRPQRDRDHASARRRHRRRLG